ncbi:HAD family phosphatase [Candidatus Saccharibacteria bacterium]|nr:HAD family phosphatase [Candidatus Saccharibacteria bacterium]
MKRKFAVFDIDGTLIRWQLYHAVVDKLAKTGALGPDTHQKIHEARMKWKRREGDDGFYAYEQTLVKLYEQAITTLSPEDFDTTTKQVIEEYKDQVYTYTRDLVQRLKGEGYVLLAVSGSQKELVAKIADHYGFDDFIATDYRRTSGKFSGEVTVASHDKRAALQTLIEKHGLTTAGSYAVGDSKSDADMLAMVDNPIAFNPDKNLFNEAKKHGWRVVIERKNMIYELDCNGETYQLINGQ